MKKSIVIASLLLLFGVAESQDTLIMKDGSLILAKILEISADKVKYKTWSNQEGPTWTKSLDNIYAIRRKEENAGGNNIVQARENYIDDFNLACDNQNTEGIIYWGEKYLSQGEGNEILRVISIVAKLYATQRNETGANNMIDRLKEYSHENDDMLEDDVIQLQHDVDSLLHLWRFEDGIIGKWVLLDRVSYSGIMYETLYSPLILDVVSVKPEKREAHLFLSMQDVPKQRRIINPSLAYTAQINTTDNLFCNGMSNYAAFSFASIKIKDRRNNTDLVHSALETNRDTRARMNATIASSNASLGDKIAASVLTAVTISAMDAIVKSWNTSSKTEEVYNLVLFPRNQNTMNAYVSYVNVTTKTSENTNPQSVYDEFVKDKRMQFVRWEESDSIFFVSKNCLPITLSAVSLDDPMLDEYNSIKKKYTLLNPVFGIPFISGNIICGALMYFGDKKMRSSIEGEEEYRSGKLYAGTGFIGMLLFNVSIGGICHDGKTKAFMELNQRNIAKLRNKTRATLSMAPAYDPSSSTLGAAVNLSF